MTRGGGTMGGQIKMGILGILSTISPACDLLCLFNSTRRQILDSSKLNEFADDNFKLDENGRKFSKWVENTVGKGEIAHCEQFLLFSQCFPKTCTADT